MRLPPSEEFREFYAGEGRLMTEYIAKPPGSETGLDREKKRRPFLRVESE